MTELNAVILPCVRTRTHKDGESRRITTIATSAHVAPFSLPTGLNPERIVKAHLSGEMPQFAGFYLTHGQNPWGDEPAEYAVDDRCGLFRLTRDAVLTLVEGSFPVPEDDEDFTLIITKNPKEGLTE